MLTALLDSPVKEKILLFLLVNEGSYPREIARKFAFNLNAVLYQLKKLERAGWVSIQEFGRTRLYSLNPGCPLRCELEALLQKAFDALSADDQVRYRVRPRRTRGDSPAPKQPAAQAGRGFSSRPAAMKRPPQKKRPPRKIHPYPQKAETLDFSSD